MRAAHFRTLATDKGGGAKDAKVWIERDTGIFYVRILRKHRVYLLPLSTVATLVIQKTLFVEARDKRRDKAMKRKLKRGS